MEEAIGKPVFEEEAMAPARRLLYYLERKRADQAWYLRFLGTLADKDIKCPIFERDYVFAHPQTQKKVERLKAEATAHQCSMLQGLPKLTRKQIKSRGRGPNVTEEKKVEKQVAALAVRQATLAVTMSGKQAILQNLKSAASVNAKMEK